MEGRVQRARMEDARHDQERDRTGQRHAEDDAIHVVVVVGRQDERPGRWQVLNPGDAEVEEPLQERRAPQPEQPVEGREALDVVA